MENKKINKIDNSIKTFRTKRGYEHINDWSPTEETIGNCLDDMRIGYDAEISFV